MFDVSILIKSLDIIDLARSKNKEIVFYHFYAQKTKLNESWNQLCIQQRGCGSFQKQIADHLARHRVPDLAVSKNLTKIC